MTRLLLLEPLIVLAAKKSITNLSDVKFFAASVILPTMLDPLLSNYFGKTPRDLSRFVTLIGNLPQFLYRGFILENVRRILGGENAAMVAAIVVQAALSGAGHAYQGPVGTIPIAAGGIVYGLLYWAGGRRPWPLILGHGVVDTIGLTSMFKGGTP